MSCIIPVFGFTCYLCDIYNVYMIDMENLQRLYPIGIQTFSKIREGNYLYIDKTEYVYRMTHSASDYMFLSRPRRF